MSENKVHFGLKKAYYAVITETADAQGNITTTYGNPKPWPGAVGIDLSANGSQTNFYADDSIYYVTSSTNNYEGDFESASVPEDFKKDIYGDVTDSNGALFEIETQETKYFALMYETSGDVGGQRTVFYKCSATRPSASSTTTEDGTEVQTQTVTIKAIGRADSVTIGATQYKPIQATLKESDTGYSTFFNAVYVPVNTP